MGFASSCIVDNEGTAITAGGGDNATETFLLEAANGGSDVACRVSRVVFVCSLVLVCVCVCVCVCLCVCVCVVKKARDTNPTPDQHQWHKLAVTLKFNS